MSTPTPPPLQDSDQILTRAILGSFIYKFNSSTYVKFLDLAVLISGGSDNEGSLQSVEIYNPATNTGCSLPQLPETRAYHTQDGGLACGGIGNGMGSGYETCVKWSSESGSWTQSHTLREDRYSHVSWKTEDGVYLMGGLASQNKTILVKEDGSSEYGFILNSTA